LFWPSSSGTDLSRNRPASGKGKEYHQLENKLKTSSLTYLSVLPSLFELLCRNPRIYHGKTTGCDRRNAKVQHSLPTLTYDMQTAYIEYGLSRLFASAKGRDARLFTKGSAFSQISKPNIDLASDTASGSQLHVDQSAEGAGQFPSLSWPAASPDTKEFLLVSEDPDAPLPSPIIHGIYYGISATTTAVTNADFELEDAGDYALKGGFRYGKNRRGNIYIPPRPLLGHGEHRYFFTLVALSAPIDSSKLSDLPTIQEIAQAIEGNVVGWGEWVGVYERKWE
jgi:phosphatidylethanolamine-binding protein (PEBP) family uncharacterized protein